MSDDHHCNLSVIIETDGREAASDVMTKFYPEA
jgi:hypothetical protein